jgi:hypothetical protein
MSQGGARAGQDARKLIANAQEQRLQLAMNDVQIKLECHQRAVSSTTLFERIGETERTTPAATEIQLAYAKAIYDWVTTSLVIEPGE